MNPETTRRPLRILTADDNEDSRDMLAILLEHDGYAVATAADGAQALAAAETFLPDVVILDIGMPGLTGYDVAERLRKSASTERMVIVALSGFGQDRDKARAAEAGFDHHFTKPINIEALRSLLASIPQHES